MALWRFGCDKIKITNGLGRKNLQCYELCKMVHAIKQVTYICGGVRIVVYEACTNKNL